MPQRLSYFHAAKQWGYKCMNSHTHLSFYTSAKDSIWNLFYSWNHLRSIIIFTNVYLLCKIVNCVTIFHMSLVAIEIVYRRNMSKLAYAHYIWILITKSSIRAYMKINFKKSLSHVPEIKYSFCVVIISY